MVGFFFFPFVFPPPAAMEALTEAERTVFLHETFEVDPGPAFHVYLVPKPNVRRSSDVQGTMFVDLGGLRSFKGSQKYAIPAGVDLAGYQSVVIWCERFDVLIAPADLKP